MQRLGLALLFALGALVALTLLALPIFVYALIRGRRAFHADGTIYRATVRGLDAVVGPRVAGPALVRVSGAFLDEGAPGTDVLGMSIRLRHDTDAPDDPGVGDQDLLFGTFRSFLTAAKDRDRTDVADYLGNEYWSVAPWRVEGAGIGQLRVIPPAAQDPARAATRLARLDADVAAGRAVLTIESRIGTPAPIAELRLVERTTLSSAALRISMFRNGRGLHPTGFRNGIRAVVYPWSQWARRLRGG